MKSRLKSWALGVWRPLVGLGCVGVVGMMIGLMETVYEAGRQEWVIYASAALAINVVAAIVLMYEGPS